MSAPWQGTLKLSTEQRRRLRFHAWISDALIDAVLPTLEYIVYWRRHTDGTVDTATRRRWATEYAGHAEAVRRVRATLEERIPLARTFLAVRLVQRGATAAAARARIDELAADLALLEAAFERAAEDARPRRGRAAQVDEHLALLIRGAAAEWKHHTGRRPGTGESSPFLDFCAALGDLAGIAVSRDKVLRILTGGN